MNWNEKPIGVFDSGVGGLTVAREVMRQMPQEKMIYFGDTARVPYGGKSKETVIRYAAQITNFLLEQDVKAIVVGCNTATAFALEYLEEHVDIPIIGVIRPGARVAAAATVNKKIGVIGTRGTVNSGIYEQYIHGLDPETKIFTKACPLFVPLVEEMMTKDEITRDVAERYLEELKEDGVDTLVLGCTHYPLLRKMIQQVMGPDVILVNPAYETALETKRILSERGLTREGDTDRTGISKEQYQFFCSDDPDHMKEFAQAILPIDVEDAKKIAIERYPEYFRTE